MATSDGRRSPELIKSRIESERTELAHAVEQLRTGLGEATDVGAKLRARLPAAAAGSLAAGFVLAGGVGAVARLLMRKSREGVRRADVGRFSLVDRR